jgi:hypothetical protein
MKNQDLTIVLLTITAAILGVILVTSMTTDNQALAGGVSIKGAEWTVIPMQMSGARDLIVIIDSVAKKAQFYVPDDRSGKIEMLEGGLDLAKAFQ